MEDSKLNALDKTKNELFTYFIYLLFENSDSHTQSGMIWWSGTPMAAANWLLLTSNCANRIWWDLDQFG